MKKFGRLFFGLLVFQACALQAADFYAVSNAAQLTIALGRAHDGARVLVYGGNYAGNWTVPAGVAVLGEPEFNPLAVDRPMFVPKDDQVPILTVLTSASKQPTQVRTLFFTLAKKSAMVVAGDGTGYVCNAFFQENHADRGGAIYAAAAGTIYIQTNYFGGNTADTDDGGAVCLEGSAYVYLKDNLFMGNMAKMDGGGLSVGGSHLVYSDQDVFEQNTARQDGGAVAIVSCTRVGIFQDARLQFNHADRDGGDMLADQSSLLVYRGSTSHSSAGRNGGSLGARKGLLIMYSYGCYQASAVDQGGGVYAEASLLSAQDSRLEKCQARFGGGMSIREPAAMKGDPLLVGRNTFFLNRAAKEGGGLYLAVLPQIQVENNVFFLNDSGIGHGIALTADVQATVANNTFAHIQYISGVMPLPTGEAIYIHGANNATKVVNNIVVGHARGVVGEANGQAVVAGNDFYRTDVLGVPNPPVALNRVLGLLDPQFVQFNPRQQIGDFHLKAISLSCNAALPQFATVVDRDGKRRDAQPDRGAYEFIAPAP